MRNAFLSALREAGLAVITVADVDRLGASDADQLAWAAEQGRVLYTFNVKDFSLLHTQWLTQGKSQAGIVVVPRQHYSIGEQVRGLLNFANCCSAEDIGNQRVYLSNHLKWLAIRVSWSRAATSS
ncbi:hypothetical protein C7271_11325 [filamentous cyanobacterium CCP5]|nr:hypothetical protein C7271_11325 [filamentous cyanobacterium CCP5]